MNSEQNKQVVRRFFEIFNTHESTDYGDVISPEYRLEFPGAVGTAYGLDGAVQATGSFISTFPDLHFTLNTVIAEGDYVAACWSMRGTQKGALGPVPGTGKQVVVTGTSMFRVAKGKIVEDRVRADLIGLMQQIGAMPTPEPEPVGL